MPTKDEIKNSDHFFPSKYKTIEVKSTVYHNMIGFF